MATELVPLKNLKAEHIAEQRHLSGQTNLIPEYLHHARLAIAGVTGLKPEDMPFVAVPAAELTDGRIWIVQLLRLAGLASTGGEARRLIQQGGVSIGADADSLQIIQDPTADVAVYEGAVLKVGKRRFCRLKLAGKEVVS